MTPQEALDYLVEKCVAEHRIYWNIVGPSHGDPGGYSYITSACPCVVNNGYSVLAIDERNQCDCGATQANQKTRAARQILQQLINPQTQ